MDRLLRNMLVLAVEQRTTGEPSPISRRLVYGIEDSLSPGRLTRLVARPRSTVRASINQISAAALVAPCRRSLRQALRIPLTASVGTLRLDQLQQLAFALGRKGQCPARAVYMQAYREG